jgi:hypothetical protein
MKGMAWMKTVLKMILPGSLVEIYRKARLLKLRSTFGSMNPERVFSFIYAKNLWGEDEVNSAPAVVQ